MDSVSVVFERSDTIEFIMDNDPELHWMGTFDCDKFDRFFVFIDANVRGIWGEAIAGQLEKHGKQTYWLCVEPEEATKSLSFYPEAVEFLEQHGCGRFDLVLAIGGGIVCDLVSFLTSTYMRGLPFYAVPTTLIGQMDATTAGKTCLNTPNGKNVLGTFYYPQIVFNNIAFLSTNSPFHLRQGYSEVYKYGLLESRELIEKLEAYRKNSASSSLLLDIVRMSIQARVAIRLKDPLASNLGHTFGHAMEKMSNFEILHGDAISAGTVMALHFACQEGILAETEMNRILATMKKLNLNIYHQEGLSAAEMVRLMLRDKKSAHDRLNLVLIRGVAEPYATEAGCFYQTSPAKVEAFLNAFFEEGRYALKNCASFLKRDELYS